jgi:putative addiction module component (TIGR02574 family)
MILEQHPELSRLSTSEKLLLVSELWDALAADPSNIPVAPEHLAELDRRMEEYQKDPSQVTTWEAIKAGLLRSDAGAGAE